MTTFVCWKWKSPSYRQVFTADHVNTWARGLKSSLRGEAHKHRFICVTDDPACVEIETYPLWSDLSGLTNPSGKHLPSCYRRLKLFSGAQTRDMGIPDDEKVVWIDLDVLFVNDTRPMWNRNEPFVGWRGVGADNPEVYNGTIVMFRAGKVEYLWTEFDPERTPRMVTSARYFGSDQGWLSYRMSGRGTAFWSVRDGMYSFSRDIRPARSGFIPASARIISFNGKWKAWDPDVQNKYPWIKKYWPPQELEVA